MTDLSLLPLEDLVNEIFERTEDCVFAYTRYEDDNPAVIKINWRDGNCLKRLGLCDLLRDRIIHDFYDQAIREDEP